jgi:hypothetical protein
MEYSFVEVTVPVSFSARQMERGYKLSNGIFLMPSQHDTEGYYLGAVGLDGMYLYTGTRFQPAYDEYGHIRTFREVIRSNMLTT